MIGITQYCAIATLVAVAVTVTTVTSTYVRPRYVECIDSTECSVGTCCLVGMGKYSVPRCSLNGELGQPCRPRATQHNVTLSYPDGQTVHFTDIWALTCPCAQGLYCSETTATCEDPYEDNKDNDIINFV